MPGMAHNHSGMHHSVVGAMTRVLEAQSCKTGCATAERLNIARRVVPHVAVVQTGTAVLDAPPEVLGPHLEGAWSLDSGPPLLLPSAYPAFYSILRI